MNILLGLGRYRYRWSMCWIIDVVCWGIVRCLVWEGSWGRGWGCLGGSFVRFVVCSVSRCWVKVVELLGLDWFRGGYSLCSWGWLWSWWCWLLDGGQVCWFGLRGGGDRRGVRCSFLIGLYYKLVVIIWVNEEVRWSFMILWDWNSFAITLFAIFIGFLLILLVCFLILLFLVYCH
jgi:hypothetical protein